MSPDPEPQAPPAANAVPPWRDALALLVVGACVGGLGEQAVRALARFLGRPATYFNPQGLWMAPLLDAAVLALPVGLLVAVGGRAGARARVAALVAFLACAQVLLLLPRIAPWALLLVAAGVASRIAALVRRHPGPVLHVVRRAAPVLAAVTIALGVGWNVRAHREETRRLRALPAAAPGRPSVLLVVLDAVRASSMSVYGGPAGTTPFLERLAPSCVRFTRAIATAPWTLPTHASLFTGRRALDLHVGWTRPLDAAAPTLAEALAARGYATGASVANYLYTYREFGLARGFASYRDYGISPAEATLRNVVGDWLVRAGNRLAGTYVVTGRKSADRVYDDLRRLSAQAGGRPTFHFVNLYDAHDPYAPPAPWDRRFLAHEPVTRALDGAWHPPAPAVVADLRRAYEGAIAYEDAVLARMVTDLQRSGRWATTVLVITADHGEEFAEHGVMQHGNTAWLEALHVPLLVCAPGGEGAGRDVDVPVSLRDVPRTILDLVDGAATDTMLGGQSLRPLWREGSGRRCRSPAQSEVEVEVPDGAGRTATHALHSLVTDTHHYIRDVGRSESLFDLRTDPHEREDLAPRPQARATLEALRAQAASRAPCAEAP